MLCGATDSTGRGCPGRGGGRAILGSALLAWLGWALVAAPAAAQVSLPGVPFERQVVIELFTAQGCSACPPADAMLAQLAMREDVIALALHVDYWDYIGWADTFALPEHKERQKRYARRNGHSTIYTPQVIVNGADVIEGFRVMQVMNAIELHRVRPAPVVLELDRVAGGLLRIRARPRDRAAAGASAVEGDDRLGVYLIRYMPHASVLIEAGENAGRRGEYHNIVTSWQTVATWDMHAPLEISVRVEGGDPIVVLVQERGQGEIVAAARLH